MRTSSSVPLSPSPHGARPARRRACSRQSDLRGRIHQLSVEEHSQGRPVVRRATWVQVLATTSVSKHAEASGTALIPSNRPSTPRIRGCTGPVEPSRQINFDNRDRGRIDPRLERETARIPATETPYRAPSFRRQQEPVSVLAAQSTGPHASLRIAVRRRIRGLMPLPSLNPYAACVNAGSGLS